MNQRIDPREAVVLGLSLEALAPPLTKTCAAAANISEVWAEQQEEISR